jgi:hypothetical protein
MDDAFLRETFLYGNLELGFSSRQLKKIDISSISLRDSEFNISFCWRSYKNFKTLFSIREPDVLNDIESYKKLIKLYKNYVDLGENHYKISDRFINIKPSDDRDYFIISVYSQISELETKLRSYNNQDLSKMFGTLFYEYLPFIRDQKVILTYNSAFRDNEWKPRWKFIYGSEQIKLEFIDCYLDTYFYNPKFEYTPGMYKEIEHLRDRLEYVKNKASDYFEKCIVPNIEIVTQTIFNRYPYQIIFKEYPKIIDIQRDVYKPDLYKAGKFDTEIGWMLCVLPPKISAFLLGYPVISCGIPSTQDMAKAIVRIQESGLDTYLDGACKRNKTILEGLSFGVHLSNGIDSDGEHVDLLYERVIDYNFDDFILFYNSKASHIFTSPEFNDISKKQINPYNNITRIPMIDRIKRNLEMKHVEKKELRERGLSFDFNGTMGANIEDILNNIKSSKIIEQKQKSYRFDVQPTDTLRSLFPRLADYI